MIEHITYWYGDVMDERGQGLVEYILLLVLVAIAVIAILTILGDQLSRILSELSIVH